MTQVSYFRGMITIRLLVLSWITSFFIFSAYGSDSPVIKEETLDSFQSKIVKRALSNGMRVIMFNPSLANRDGAQAPIFSGAVTVRVGGTDEPSGASGIAHMLEHMAFKGTRTLGTRDYQREAPLLAELEIYEKKRIFKEKFSQLEEARYLEIKKELESLWILGEFAMEYENWGGIGLNATTDSELTKYFVDLPKTAFEFWCKIESERLLFPVMRQFYEERDVVMEERRMRVDSHPSGKLYEMLLATAFTKHPYKHPVIGYSRDIQSLSAEATSDFHKKYYVPSNIVISLGGAIDPEEDLETVEKYFGRVAKGREIVRDIPLEPEQLSERKIELKDRAKPMILISYKRPAFNHPEEVALSVFEDILANGETSPLYHQLVRKQQIASTLSYFIGPGDAYANLITFSIIPNLGKRTQAGAPINNQIVLDAFDKLLARSLAGEFFTEKELEISKRRLGVQYLQALRSSSLLASELASAELLYGDWREVFEWYRRFSKVTLEEVKAAGKKFLKKEKRTVAKLEAIK
jgi:predicted Zn-dependent peptidase